ncbi:rRNA pseudouridine synthase [Intrasporangium calvum]|uniref:Pseudouridine synthase n=1 Tax=Intrasporangium calvum TaxID=53358 RepID=A0ABT5GBT4_9MICO|nr:pseudouridine synthase [Intrasporangium calvum]MDC5695674.1 rRNA pseudouridine synthase [Intrasporangium calvum]
MSEHSRSPRQPRKRGAAPSGGAKGPRGSGSKPARAGGSGGSGGSRKGAGGSGKRTAGPRFAGATKPSQPTRLPSRPTTPQVDVHDPDGVRLQKLMAAAGVGSRRVCENLIEQGRVEVDGQVVTELGVRINPQTQAVHVDGVRVNLDEDRVYLAFNKPKGVVTTMNDELGRISLADYVGNREQRLFHVGRLDADTEGLLLLTNDGDLAHRLQHPAYGVLKTYLATVRGPIGKDVGKQLRQGVELEDGPVTVDSFKVVDSQPGKALIEVVLHEGRKHVVRRMLEAVGHPVLELVRTEVGPIRLGDLRSGRMRRLNKAEVGALYQAAGL